MKIVHSVAFCSAMLAAGSVVAADPPTAPKSRAEVRQEAINARATGQTGVGDLPSYPAAPVKTTPKPRKAKKKQDSTTPSTTAAPAATK